VSDEVTPPVPGPLADHAGGASFLDWPGTLDGVLKLDSDTAIPGNGNPITKADVLDFRNKIEIFVRYSTRDGWRKAREDLPMRADRSWTMTRYPTLCAVTLLR
jgi:hypothetical protein